MFKRIHALTMSCILAVLIVSLATGGELRKLGEYDLSWGPYNTTWTSPGGKVVRYLPRYFDNNAFADNLSLFGLNVTGNGTGYITGFGIPLYVTNYLSVLDALTAWTDVRAYGAVGDNTTDDTAAIQAAIDNSTGIVFFPPGIYVISSSLSLKSNIIYTGSLGSSMPTGDDHPITGRGSALRWSGAANGVMVDAKGIRKVIWEGIDLDGVDYTDNVTGIRHWSINDPVSSGCRFRHFMANNLGYGVIVGGLESEAIGSHAYQADGWQITDFSMTLVNTGILINGGNASQASTIGSGNINYYGKGIYIKEGSTQRITDMSFGNLDTPAADGASIVLGLSRVTTIERSMNEPWAPAAADYFIRFNYGQSNVPTTLFGNYLSGGIILDGTIASQKVISIGNYYSGNVYINSDDSTYDSKGDYFYTSYGFDTASQGTNNTIREEQNYYEGVGQVPYRKYFNEVLVANHTYNAVDFINTSTLLTDGSATPSVSGGKLFYTYNSAPTTITNFSNGVDGQHIIVQAVDDNTTIDFSGSYIRGNSGVDNTLVSGDWLDCNRLGGYWYCFLGKWQ